MCALWQTAVASTMGGKTLAKLTADITADSDGTAEAQARLDQLKGIFAEEDLDGNGYHTVSEIQEAILKQGKGSLKEGFKEADSNNDGFVVEKEYLAFLPEKSKKDFAEMDLNKDGKHSLEEQILHFTQTKPFLEEKELALKTARRILQADDKNHDGRISEEEFLEHSKTLLKPLQDEASFKLADKNNDGFHTVDEIIVEIMRLGGFDRHPDGHFIEYGVKDAFAVADVNKDSVVTKEEYLKAFEKSTSEDFDRSDANKDGKTTLNEVMKHQSTILKDSLELAKKEAKEYVASADKNGDGKLNLKEKILAIDLKNEAVDKKHKEDLFKNGDTNGDGFHDQQEIKNELMRLAGYNMLKLKGKQHFKYYVPDVVLEGFQLADENKDDEVSRDEFVKVFDGHKDAFKDFDEHDHDGDGKHTLEEMATKIFSTDEFKKLHAEAETDSHKIMKEADANRDGRISDKEFLAHLLLVQDGEAATREL